MSAVSGQIFQELDFFVASFWLGVLLVVIYDGLRVFRQIVPHSAFWLSLEDFCYWIGAAFAIFAMLYQKNDGLIRGFAIGGVVIGMLLYNYLVSGFVVRYLVFFLKKLIHLVEKILGLLVWPAKKVIRTCVPKYLILKRFFKKLIKNLKKHLKKLKNELKMGITK